MTVINTNQVDRFRANGLFILFMFLSFIYVFYPFKLYDPKISADAVFDALIVRNIISGDGLGWQATLQPPFHAILTAVIYPLVKDILQSGIIVSKLMWWIMPFPVYMLAKEMFGSRVGLFSAVLVFFHPHFGNASNGMESTVTYTTLLLFGFCFTWLAVERKSFLYAFMGGLFFSFAYLSRSEGLLILLILIGCLALIITLDYLKKRENKKRLLILFVVVFGFILTSLPYILFLNKTYGKIVLSPKSTYVQIWMKSRVYRDNDLGEHNNPELWGLSRNGKLMWQEPKGTGDLIAYLMSHPMKSVKVYLNNFSKQIPGRIPNNSGQPGYPQTYPWYFVAPALLWFVLSLKEGEMRRKNLLLMSPFGILFVLPIFSAGWWKYLLPYSPFLIIMAVSGYFFILKKVRMGKVLPLIVIAITLYSVWTVKRTSFVKVRNPDLERRHSVVKEQIKVGKLAKNKLQDGSNFMIKWSKLAYYLNGQWTAKPVSNYAEMIWYARKHKVDYIVYEVSKKLINEFVRSMGRMPDLEVAGIYKSPESDYGVVFFKLLSNKK